MTEARPLAGIAMILVATAFFATGDNLTKATGAVLPVVWLLWLRYGVQALTMGVWLGRGGLGAFRTAHPRFQIGRGLLLLATSAMSFIGLQYMPAAEFTALGMLTPVVVTVLAATVLHEPVSAGRWILVWGGFLGALIVIRPGAGVFGATALFPIAMAFCYGGFQLLTSRLVGIESPSLTQFWTGLVGWIAVTPLMLAGLDAVLPALRAASLAILVGAVAVGVCATVGHLLLIHAFDHAPMTTLVPFLYAQIAFATAVGWVIFRHVPDAWAWAGMAVIAACGAGTAWLNARANRSARTDDPASVVAADTVQD